MYLNQVLIVLTITIHSLKADYFRKKIKIKSKKILDKIKKLKEMAKKKITYKS